MQPLTIAQADTLTQDWIEAHVDLQRARENYDRYPFQVESQKLNRPTYTPTYEWAMDPDGEIYALVEVGVDQVKPGEGEWEIALQYETTQQYIRWFREGHLPPPIFVVRNAHDGHLCSINRRRWLAARAAGVKTLMAFYSPTLPSGRVAWELRPCTWNRQHVCREYAQGRDCTTCEYYAQVKAAQP